MKHEALVKGGPNGIQFGDPLMQDRPDPMPWCPKLPQTGLLVPEAALELYRALNVVGKLLSWHGISWFVSHGTLLGAMRHGGLCLRCPHSPKLPKWQES